MNKIRNILTNACENKQLFNHLTIETHFATYVSRLLCRAKILNTVQERTINIDFRKRIMKNLEYR